MPNSRQSPEIKVYVNGDPDPLPEFSLVGVDIEGEMFFSPQLQTASRGLGSMGLDTAVLTLDRINADKLLNGGLSAGEILTFRVEIESEDAGESKTIHYGQLAKYKLQSGPDDDIIHILSATRPYMIGDPLMRQYMLSEGEDVRKVETAFVFNPVVDGIVTGNRSNETHSHQVLEVFTGEGTADRDTYVFESLESARTRTTADRPAKWTFSEAVHYLVSHLANDKFFTTLPSEEEIRQQLTADDSFLETINNSSLRNVAIPYGTFLTTALDMVLSSHGWSWYVKHDGDSRTLQFVNTAEPSELVLPWAPKAGEALNTDEHDTFQIDIEYDVTALANRVEVFGSLVRTEATFELKKGWPAEYDDLTYSDLLDVYASEGQENVRKRDAWTKWPLNEAGDYNDLEGREYSTYNLGPLLTDINASTSSTPPREIDQPVVRRRRFLPTLSTRTDGTPAGPHNGILVQVKLNGETEWQILPDNIGVYIHSNECAISFTQPIKEFEAVRVCATIEGDARIRHTIDNDETSINSQPVTQVVWLPGRFQYNYVDESSAYYIQGGLDTEDQGASWLKSVAADDSVDIADYAKQFQEVNDTADVVATIKLDGLDRYSYDLGFGVQEIYGRGIRTNGKSDTAPKGFYPVIEQIVYSRQDQSTTLKCRTNRRVMR